MARKFFLEQDEFSSKTIDHYKKQWINIPCESARNAIAVENQGLDYQRYLLENIRHHNPDSDKPALPIGLSIRAGQIKILAMSAAAIAECAVQAHAKKRNLKKLKKRTPFGLLLKRWLSALGRAGNDLQNIWEELEHLRDQRNRVHLYNAIEKKEHFDKILKEEEKIFNNSIKVLEHLKEIKSR